MTIKSNVLSRNVVAQVFGSEVEISARPLDDSGAEIREKAVADNMIRSAHVGSNLVEVANHDGIKPTKSPRTSPADVEVSSGEEKKTDEGFADALGHHITKQLETVMDETRKHQKVVTPEGKLGPNVVKYDVGSHVGSFIISNDRLGVNSQCNFGSVKASTCVFKGKWQYEVQLGSKGVMQLGWATVDTKFSQERGVGDTIDSYAYDGNRLRKWNKTTSPYGETWQAGDIIGCCIDLDEGRIEFYRNGKSLGVAFSNIRRGPGVAYFPAASLAFGENVVSNFGATPFQYGIVGFSPLQQESSLDNAKTDLLLGWFHTVLSLYPESKFRLDFGGNNSQDYESLLVITNRLTEFLGPHLQCGFIVEQSFFPFFASCLGLPRKISHDDHISDLVVSYEKTDLLLDILWTFLEEAEIKTLLERMCIILMNQFRSNSLNLSYPYQHHSLYCMLALTRHRTTRRHLIRYLLFDKTKLMHFLHIRPMDETVLKEVIQETWWPGKSPVNSSGALAYEQMCQVIQERINDLQSVQVTLLKNLLTNTDGTDKRPSSRALFLRKFRQFIRDIVRPGSVLHQPVNKAMATFFCFVRTITELYSEEVDTSSKNKLPDLPSSMFYDTSVSYFELERVGGLASYLYKTHHGEVSHALSIPDYISTSTTPPPTRAPHAGIHREHRDTPFPSAIHLNTPIPSETENEDTTIVEPSLDGTQSALPTSTITIAVPRIQPMAVEPVVTVANDGAIPTTGQNVTLTLTAQSGPVARIEVQALSTPRSVAPQTIHLQRDQNNGTNVSATSSADEIPTAPVPHLGTALIAGTPSGHSMLIPMLTDFRNLIAQGEHGFTYFPGGFLGIPGGGVENRNSVQPHNPAVALLGKDCGMMDARASLRELLDDAIIIYSCGMQRHIEKIVTLRNTMEDYVKALKRTTANLSSDSLTQSERTELQKSLEIFSGKLDEQARHVAWIKSVVFTAERQALVYQLLRNMLATLKSASKEGPLFTFVPEHYISTLINLTWCLLTQMHPTVAYTSLPGIEGVLCEVAEFVATHFADSRIIIADTKDTLTQALSSFICNRVMLTALEQMPQESKSTMVKAILRPYENRAWAQSNWMLVRFWQGSGFGFQFPNALEARRSFRAKPVQDEFGISTNLPPTPSPVLQSHVATAMLENQTFAVSYVHSVLNQLNWAFSEFVGLLQEIQNAAQRPERVFIESRQLKICCTCFELTQALLRVMEMISNIASPVMTDSSRDSADPLLARLCMLLSQILNRIGSNTGCFAQTMELDIPGLENINYYPLLSAVAGIVVALIAGDIGKADPEMIASKALLSEPSFQIGSLNFFFGRNQPPLPEGKRNFSLWNHVPDDISETEISTLEKVVTHLQTMSDKLQTEMDTLDDDEICTICYAYPKNTTFKPCSHRACKTCILHHLMNRGECFFCKATIQQVVTDDGAKVYDSSTAKKNNDDHARRAVTFQ